jgi:acyl-CoA reductase-like NAD-dependent aldehyde dehydrogenase
MEAAKHLKPCVFELGGKAPVVVCMFTNFIGYNPNIWLVAQVLDDADIDAAAEAIVFGALLHSGQLCISTERVIAQGEASKLISKICALAKAVRAGDPSTNADVQLSALFSENSAQNVLDLIRDAQADGAEVLVGDLSRHGSVVQPHVVTGVKPGMRLWERETFGPG